MTPTTKDRVIELTPIVIKHVRAQAFTLLPASGTQGRKIAGNKRADIVRANVLKEVKENNSDCECKTAKIVELVRAIAVAVELVYQTLKNLGLIKDGLYVG